MPPPPPASERDLSAFGLLDDDWREPLRDEVFLPSPRDSDVRLLPALVFPSPDFEVDAGRLDPPRLRDAAWPVALPLAAPLELFDPAADPFSPALDRSVRSSDLPLRVEAVRDEDERAGDGERVGEAAFFVVLPLGALLDGAAAAFFGGAASVASLAAFFLLKSGI